MTNPAYQDGKQTGGIRETEICCEIGERIWADLDREPARLSPRLIGLMKRLRDRPWNASERGA